MIMFSVATAHMGAACAERPSAKKEDVMIETIEYWTNAPDDAFPTRLTLTRNGAAELEVTSNDDDPAMANIGRFSKAVDAATFELLAQAVATPAFTQHPNPGPVEPGGVIRRFNVRFADGHDVKRHVVESVDADAGFTQAEQVALRIAADLRRHPRVAVAIEMKVAPGATRDDLVLDVTVTNVGKESLVVPHPSRWMETGMALHVTARRSDVPLAQMSNEHQTFVELGQDALASASASTVPRPTLEPGQKQLFSFNVRLPLPAGKYDIWGALILQLLTEQGKERLTGELVSPKFPLVR